MLLQHNIIHTHLAVSTLIGHFSKNPINPVVTWQEDWIAYFFIFLTHTLLQLDSNGDQFLALVHIEHTDRGNVEIALSCGQSVHNFHITDIYVTSLHVSKLWQACYMLPYNTSIFCGDYLSRISLFTQM